jgi:hypothetical protein
MFALAPFSVAAYVLGASFALAFSSASTIIIRLSVEISYILCFRLVAKSLQDTRSFEIMATATNMLGKADPKHAISPANSCIS